MKYLLLSVVLLFQSLVYAQPPMAGSGVNNDSSFHMKADVMITVDGKIDKNGNRRLGDMIYVGNVKYGIEKNMILCDSMVMPGEDSNYYFYNVSISNSNFPELKGRVLTYNWEKKQGILEGNVAILKKNYDELIIGSYAELDFSDRRYKIFKLD